MRRKMSCLQCDWEQSSSAVKSHFTTRHFDSPSDKQSLTLCSCGYQTHCRSQWGVKGWAAGAGLWLLKTHCSVIGKKWNSAYISRRDEAPVLQTPIAVCGLCFSLIVQIQEHLSVSLPQHDEAKGPVAGHKYWAFTWNVEEEICAYYWSNLQMKTTDMLKRKRLKREKNVWYCTFALLKIRLLQKPGFAAICASLLLSLFSISASVSARC